MPQKKRYREEDLTGASPEPPSLLRQAGGAAMSGLSGIGNLLDLPGSMVRDTIAGQNPLDQILNPFGSQNRTTGRDLNRMGGLAGSKDTIGNWWGGLGTEVATDPLTYLTGGLSTAAKTGFGKIAAKTGIHGLESAKIGTAASKAGKVAGLGKWMGPREANLMVTGRHIQDFAPDMFASLQNVAKNQKGGAYDLLNNMDTPLGALGQFWPAGEAGLFGTGKTAQKIARGMDVAGDMLRHTKIPGTNIMPVATLTNLVNKRAGGAKTAEDLQTAYHTFHSKEGARYEHRLLTAKWANDLERIGHKATDTVEVRDWLEFPNKAPVEAQPLVKEIRQYIDRIPQIAGDMGVKIGDVTPKMAAAGSNAKYYMRYIAEGLAGNKKSGFGKLFDPAAATELDRLPWTHGSRGGTKALTEMAKDPILEGIFTNQNNASPKGVLQAAKEYIQQKYVDDPAAVLGGQQRNLPNEFITKGQGRILKGLGLPQTVAGAAQAITQNPDLLHKLKPKRSAGAAARTLYEMSPEVRKSGIYANHPINDFAAAMSGTMDKLHASKIALERMAEAALPAAGQGTVPVPVVLKNLDLEFGDGTTKGAIKWLKDHGVADPENAHLAPETAEFLTQMGSGWKGGPKDVHAAVKLYDDFSKVMKAIFTNLDPIRFNVRNRISGLFSNWMAGLDGILSGNSKDVRGLMSNMAIEGAAKNPHLMQMAAERGIQNLDDKRATEMLAEIMYALEATGSYGVAQAHGTGLGGKLDDIKQAIPGGHPFSWGEVGSKAIGGFGKSGTTLNPITSWRGIGGATDTKFAPLAAGEDISHLAESLNRMAPVWAQIQDGVHPVEAAKRMLEAQVDYRSRNYTEFEQQVLKRIMLFYSFSKGQFPFSVNQLLNNPGGKLAQTLRVMNRTKDQDEPVPQHIAESASIPIGHIPGMAPLEEGAKRYITGMGLGFEDPAQFVGGPKNAALEAISRMNPVLKGPIEGIFGQSTFQRGPGGGGRSLEDLDPALGRTLSNIRELTTGEKSKAPVRYPGSGVIEHVLSNSPLSTVLNKARTATDPRKGTIAKGVNLFTGFKATDVSPQSQDRELRNRIGQIEKQMGGREFRTSYVPKEIQEGMSPSEKKKYEQLKALAKLLEARAKERKK